MRTLMRRGLTPLAVILLAACGDAAEKAPGDAAEQSAPSSRTLAATLEAESGFGSLNRATANAGLADVLDGVGPYTLFAPVDAAFSSGGAPADLTDEARRAEGAELLRAHIVPGALTRRDIEAALTKDADGQVQMRTMAGTLITFSREGEVVTATSENGARARVTGEEVLASNGVLQPVDALLVRAAENPPPAT